MHRNVAVLVLVAMVVLVAVLVLVLVAVLVLMAMVVFVAVLVTMAMVMLVAMVMRVQQRSLQAFICEQRRGLRALMRVRIKQALVAMTVPVLVIAVGCMRVVAVGSVLVRRISAVLVVRIVRMRRAGPVGVSGISIGATGHWLT